MTLRSLKPIVEILQTGSLEGTPVSSVYSYRGIQGREQEQLYAVFLTPESDDIYQSPYVDQSSIVPLFFSPIVTKEGNQWLQAQKG